VGEGEGRRLDGGRISAEPLLGGGKKKRGRPRWPGGGKEKKSKKAVFGKSPISGGKGERGKRGPPEVEAGAD